MESNHIAYNYMSSFRRIDEILALPAGNYEEVDNLPDRDKLTFTNGYYANCTAVFVDIRDSSSLPGKYTRPVLAKLYRAYISEVVAILNGSELAREINIVGDGVWAVFRTPWTTDLDNVFELLAKINSLMMTLNYKLAKAGYDKGEIRAGIGADWGRALMIKAGFSGSGINDVVYMGDVVNRAAKLAAEGNKIYNPPFSSRNPPIFMSSGFASNLDEETQKKCCKPVFGKDCYTADVVDISMKAWHEANCI